MKLHLVFVGKTNSAEADAGIKRYLDRIRHTIPTEVHIVRAEKITRKSEQNRIREVESDRILSLVPAQGFLIVWDERGKQLDSRAFAQLLERLRDGGTQSIWMVVGGPLGVGPDLRERADRLLSLSKMTFPHDLARLIVVEQIYRAFTILRGEPYHK